MYTNRYKQHVLLTGVILICAFLVIPVLGRDKGGNPSSRSAGRSDSAPRASQADSSMGSSRAAAPSQPAAQQTMSAPSSNRASRDSVSQRQSQPRVTSQPRSIESRPASPQRNTQRSVEQSSRFVSSPAPAPASQSTNESNRGRAASSRPVQRTVQATGTAQLNRASSVSGKSSASSGAVAVSSRSSRTITTPAVPAKAEPKATPSSVSRKIEPSVARSASPKPEVSSRAANDNQNAQSTRGNDRVTKVQPERVTVNSLSGCSAATRDSQEKTTAASRQVRTIDRTTVSSRTATTTDSRLQRSMSSDQISKRIHAGRSDRSKTDSSPATVASVADGTKDLSAPSLTDGLRREGREDRGGREGRQRSGTASGDVRTAANAGRDTSSTFRSGTRTERSGSYDRQRQPQVVINNTNNVIVRGDVSTTHVRPHISSRRLSHDISYVHHDSHWRRHDYHHGSHSSFYFSFVWSPYSCGQVVYLPYSYHHSWVHYPVGTHYGLSYYYPSYHRRFIFVSIGGYWPVGYRYSRYYWYGCHPYYWYGPDVVAYPAPEVNYNTYNTYNTYTTNPPAAQPASVPYYELGNPKPAENTQPVDEPQFQTAADMCFERAVELFEAGNYKDAVAQFREAVTLTPEDVVLPFTYAQALFANGEYALAAGVLRAAVAQIPEDELTIYYPRGLYKDDKILMEQVAQLEAATVKEPFSADYQLLLGYQYMGLGDLNKAQGPLTEAAKSQANQTTVAKLMELAAKLQTEPEKDGSVK